MWLTWVYIGGENSWIEVVGAGITGQKTAFRKVGMGFTSDLFIEKLFHIVIIWYICSKFQ